MRLLGPHLRPGAAGPGRAAPPPRDARARRAGRRGGRGAAGRAARRAAGGRGGRRRRSRRRPGRVRLAVHRPACPACSTSSAPRLLISHLPGRPPRHSRVPLGDHLNTHFRALRPADGHGRRWRADFALGALHRDRGNSATCPAAAPSLQPAGSHDAVLSAAPRTHHRRHRRPRDGLGRRWRTVGGQHPASRACARWTQIDRFVPRWRPPFVSRLARRATAATSTAWRMRDGRPRYVTALGTTDDAGRLARGASAYGRRT